MLALVALRLGIGWHFFQEGASKIRSGKFSSAGFLAGAKGPLAESFRGLVYDVDGRWRLNLPASREAFKAYRETVVAAYGFDKPQQELAKQAQRRGEDQLKWLLDDNSEDVTIYFGNLRRRDEQTLDSAMQGVESLRGQSETLKAELKKKSVPWLAQVDNIWKRYVSDLASIRSAEQRTRPMPPLVKPGQVGFDSRLVDRVIPYFDLAVGMLLVVGLFSRIASLAGAALLANVILTQFPGTPGATPTYYQVVELLALLVLAAIGAGRYLGLDFYIQALRMRCCPPNQG